MCNPSTGTLVFLLFLSIALGALTVMAGPFKLLLAIDNFVEKHKIIFWILGILVVVAFVIVRKHICGG